VIPVAKTLVWKRDGEELLLVLDPRECIQITDPQGQVESLLTLLKDGTRTTAELAADLGNAVTAADVDEAVALLDAHRLLEAVDGSGRLTQSERERYHSNLAFFAAFADLGKSRIDYQQQLRDSHVLVLGTGGLNCNTIPHLCGLGVGALTLVDRDCVEPRNFARQYLYRWSQIGDPKARAAADWVRNFDRTIKVSPRRLSIDGIEAVETLLDECRPDVVMDGADHPDDIDLWVNDACVAARVPMVRAGMTVTMGTVWSVDARTGTACRHCLFVDKDPRGDPENELAEAIRELYLAIPRTNRGIGPVAGLLGSLATFEVLRYLTGFEPPAYAGATLQVDFANACAITRHVWDRSPRCPACSGLRHIDPSTTETATTDTDGRKGGET
jgi:molybdopterin/thiamine biosynthesis adenylyltransferase